MLEGKWVYAPQRTRESHALDSALLEDSVIDAEELVGLGLCQRQQTIREYRASERIDSVEQAARERLRRLRRRDGSEPVCSADHTL